MVILSTSAAFTIPNLSVPKYQDVCMSASCRNLAPYSSRVMFYEMRRGIRADEYWNSRAVGAGTYDKNIVEPGTPAGALPI
jgi:hypothetical protein